MVRRDVSAVREKLEGKDGRGGLCALVEKHDVRIVRLERYLPYILALLGVCTILVFGRYVVGPTALP
jgi:hypothetical protein